MSARPAAFLVLCALAMATLVLAASAVVPARGAGLALLAVLVPLSSWGGLGLAQAVIGLGILLGAPDPARHSMPPARGPCPAGPRGRVALALCARNEALYGPLGEMGALLDALPAERFEFWLLSDTRDAAAVAAEDAAFAAFCRGREGRAFLRRRPDAGGFKAGNVMSFLDAEGDRYEHAVILDADSAMAPAAVERLAAIMDAHPAIGLVQQLIVGRPATQAFPRLFQFGMRAGMRAWATGQGWWQGPRGPFWGHNAILRVAPFRRHARLAPLPDGSPVLSHDQVEAIRLHEAGWEVWLLPEEAGSLEGNPPALPEFLRRDERWGEGNMQYWAILRQGGLGWMSRWQLLQAILLFAVAPLWLLAFLLAALVAVRGGFDAAPAGALAAVMAAWWFAAFSPKLAGYAQVLLQRCEAARYGGRRRFLLGAALEIAFTTALSPVSAVNKARLLGRLALGARAGWLPQNREGRGVSWTDAARLLWPHTLAGAAAFAVLAAGAPWAIPFALPWAGGLLVAIPFCVLTAAPGTGRFLLRYRLAATPEELQPSRRSPSRLA